MAAGAAVGVPIPDFVADFGLNGGVVTCIKDLFSSSSDCKGCVESLVCCVTDSCNFCECDCHNLLRFSAPLSSTARGEHPWLFADQCHFVYIGTPACEDCDGKRFINQWIVTNRSTFTIMTTFLMVAGLLLRI